MRLKKASLRRLTTKCMQLIHDGKLDHRVLHLKCAQKTRVQRIMDRH